MPRFRKSRRNRGAVVVQNKEIVDAINLANVGNVVSNISLATTVNDYVGTVGTCPLGAAIKGFELQISYASSLVPARMDWYLIKNVGSQIVGPTPGQIGGNVARRWVIHEEKGLGVDKAQGNKKTTIHLNIPKRYWRMGEGDIWQLLFGTSLGAGDTYDLCLKAIYKWKI